MARNVQNLLETGKFVVPPDFTPEQADFFEERAEWRLERLRRTDFDLAGEHASHSHSVFDTAEQETRQHFDLPA
jgi:hypothetical protein